MKYNRVKQFDGLMLKEICSRYLFKISLGFLFLFLSTLPFFGSDFSQRILETQQHFVFIYSSFL